MARPVVYSGLAPKTISSQEGTERRRRLGLGGAGVSRRASCPAVSSTCAVGIVGALWADAAAWGDCGDRGDAAGEAALGAGARYPAPAARPAP